MLDKIKLLPCPFCGGKAELRQFINKFTRENKIYIQCTECDFKTEELDGDIAFEDAFEDTMKVGRMFINPLEFLVTKWNTRKPMQEVIDKLSEKSKFIDCISEDGEPFGHKPPYHYHKLFVSLEDALEIVCNNLKLKE